MLCVLQRCFEVGRGRSRIDFDKARAAPRGVPRANVAEIAIGGYVEPIGSSGIGTAGGLTSFNGGNTGSLQQRVQASSVNSRERTML